ncbi:MAG: chemotaxis protein CheX [Myxococcales bacterium FL481]|nr:MAG: chemotaxis protein CheX [Myxococcales bacterium FL481]
MSAAARLPAPASVLLLVDEAQAAAPLRDTLASHADVVMVTDDVDEGMLLAQRSAVRLLVISDAVPESISYPVVAALNRSRSSVVWLADALSRPISLPASFTADWVWEYPTLPEALDAAIGELTRPRFYSPWVESRLAAWSTYALLRGFDVTVRRGYHVRKTTRGLLELVSALIPFAGLAVSGRLIVSASEMVLAAICRASLGEEASDDDRQLYGLAGELANLTLGRAQRDLRSQSADFALGHPMLVSGEHFRLRYLSDRPSLVYCAEVDAGPVYFELCTDRSPERLGEGFTDGEDEGDDIVFL